MRFEKVVEDLRVYLRVKNYAPASLKNFTSPLGRFRGFLGEKGVEDLRRVTPELLREYQLSVMEGKTPEGKAYKWATQSIHIRAVKKLFSYLEEAGQVLVNPAAGMKEPSRGSRLPKGVLSVEQVERLMAAPDVQKAQGLRIRAILEVFYSTGIRLGELLRLTLMDVDLTGGFVRVNQGKGMKDRVVPLGERAIFYLKAYISKVRPGHVSGLDLKSPVFVSKTGKPMSKQMVEILVREYGKRAGIEIRVTPHALRHSFATHLVKNGADIVAVSKMMGHTRLDVTQRYAKVAGVEVKKTHGEAHPREKDGEAAQAVEPVPTLERMYRHA
jgi:integrase/recombinase XerD